MRKLVWLLALVMLCGCAGEGEPLETVGPGAYETPERIAPEVISVWLPENAAAQTGEQEDTQIYVWDDYELRLQTRSAGDLNGTLEALTGQSADRLTVVATEQDGQNRYQTVFSALGEEGVILGRCMVAQAGDNHYCVSLLSPEESDSGALYAEIVSSFRLGERDAGK